jgi:netrin receptor unc-5
VESREKVGDWYKLTVNVLTIYKKGKDKIRRGEEIVWVPEADDACGCPQLATRQTYVIIGNDVISASRVGVIADRSSVVFKWNEDIGQKVRRKAQRC